MQSALDQAITAAAAAESAVVTDQTNVANIQSAIDAATTPLAPAQAQLATDIQTAVAAYKSLSDAALAAAASLSPASSPAPTPTPAP